MATDRVLQDAELIVAEITEAWSELPPDQGLTQEVHALVTANRRATHSQQVRNVRFDPVTERTQIAIQDNLQQWAQNLARGARAQNTVDALRGDLKLYCRWCRDHGQIPLPASQDTILTFLRAHAEIRKISSLKRYLASVATLHSAAGLANPISGELVRSEVDVIAREQAKKDKVARKEKKKLRFTKRQAKGLRESDLVKADAMFGHSLRDLRDRAIVWVAFETLMRSSELAEMRIEDLHRITDEQNVEHMVVDLPYTKSNQYGDAEQRYISPFTLVRLDAWLKASGITDGYVFRGINGRFTVREAATRQVIYRTIKHCARRLGLDYGAYSAHSTRVGAAQEMVMAKIGVADLQLAGGWKTEVMPKQYASQIAALDGGSAQLARKRGRAGNKRKITDDS